MDGFWFGFEEYSNDTSDARHTIIWFRLVELGTRKGMVVTDIGQDLIDALGMTSQQDAYDAIHRALNEMPQSAYTEAIRYALGGEGFSPFITERYEILAKRYDRTVQTIKSWASTGAAEVARWLLNPG